MPCVARDQRDESRSGSTTGSIRRSGSGSAAPATIARIRPYFTSKTSRPMYVRMPLIEADQQLAADHAGQAAIDAGDDDVVVVAHVRREQAAQERVHLLEIDQDERADHQREEEQEDAADEAGDERLAEPHDVVELATAGRPCPSCTNARSLSSSVSGSAGASFAPEVIRAVGHRLDVEAVRRELHREATVGQRRHRERGARRQRHVGDRPPAPRARSSRRRATGSAARASARSAGVHSSLIRLYSPGASLPRRATSRDSRGTSRNMKPDDEPRGRRGSR